MLPPNHQFCVCRDLNSSPLFAIFFYFSHFRVSNTVLPIISLYSIIKITVGTSAGSAVVWKCRAWHGFPLFAFFFPVLIFGFSKFCSAVYLSLRGYKDHMWDFRQFCIFMRIEGFTLFATFRYCLYCYFLLKKLFQHLSPFMLL